MSRADNLNLVAIVIAPDFSPPASFPSHLAFCSLSFLPAPRSPPHTSRQPQMPFMELPERGLRVHYVINPTWPHCPPPSLKFGRVPQSNPLDLTKENIFLIHPSSSSLATFSEQARHPTPLPLFEGQFDEFCSRVKQLTDPRFHQRFNMVSSPPPAPRVKLPQTAHNPTVLPF